ncbi:MAG: hypothetical protein M3461_04410 [Pseudomonadota bacterium]|nr:hypothetical protein [Pseudomonadota bacterium]
MGYVLYIDEKPTTNPVNTLEEARQLAAPHIMNRGRLKIESLVAPAPSQIWIYDYHENDWVEQR